MNLKDFINCLKNTDVETPLTVQFDAVNGQKEKRWWDDLENHENYSSQKYHVLGHFLCWYYKGVPSKCSKPWQECKGCCLEMIDLVDTLDKEGEITVSEIYNRMKKPEMYIYIAEALAVLEENRLKLLVEEINNAKNNYGKWKAIINEYLTWDKVEEKVMTQQI